MREYTYTTYDMSAWREGQDPEVVARLNAQLEKSIEWAKELNTSRLVRALVADGEKLRESPHPKALPVAVNTITWRTAHDPASYDVRRKTEPTRRTPINKAIAQAYGVAPRKRVT